jgi:acetyl-CoA C-acetyltransferase
MTDIVITDAQRTPHGRLLGQFADLRGPELGATAVQGLLDSSGLSPDQVDHVIMGNSIAAGLGQVPARQAAYNGGVPEDVPATAVNEASGSGLRAICTGVDRIYAGKVDAVIAGGLESMSNAPFLLPEMRQGHRWGDTAVVDSMVRDALWDMFYDAHMGELTEEFVERFDITREEQDRYALRSHERAVDSRENGFFDDEIVPVPLDDGAATADEGPRPDTGMEQLAALDPVFADDGTVTAGNASDLSDGAAATLVTTEEQAAEHGIDPLAHVVDYAVAYTDPKWFPIAIEDAVRQLLDQNNMAVDDIDLFEINEAFAAHMTHFQDEIGVPAERLNVRGGAIALGHPIGASGGILTTTLVHTMQAEKATYGIVGMCVGGGGGIAMLLRR